MQKKEASSSAVLLRYKLWFKLLIQLFFNTSFSGNCLNTTRQGACFCGTRTVRQKNNPRCTERRHSNNMRIVAFLDGVIEEVFVMQAIFM